MLVKGSYEDLIYILIGIIWVAFSIYKGVKKRKTAAVSTEDHDDEPQPEKKVSVFDSFLNELMKGEEAVPYREAENEKQVEIVETNQRPSAEGMFSYDDFTEESNYIDETKVYEKEPLVKPTLNQELQSHLANQKKPRFDLRKAVIYSEILNRRYF